MNILNSLDIGSWYQNIAFYAFLLLLIYLNINLIKYGSKQKGVGSATVN